MIITPHPYSKSEGQDHLSGTSEGLKKNGFANISLSPTSKLREDLELVTEIEKASHQGEFRRDN